MKLLTKSNPKLLKSLKHGYLSAGVSLAPHKLSGYNTCPKATLGCSSTCLNFAGMGRFKSNQEARINKTKLFFEKRQQFMLQLEKEIEAFLKKTKKLARQKHKKIMPVIRLNIYSDIKWENISFVGEDGITYKNMMERFPNVQFMDYTKHSIRKNLPSNYHLTFSLAESNEDEARQALDNGLNVAIVYSGDKPRAFWNKKTVDGDEHDLRFLDGKNKIVMLKAKGRAKKDKSGFVHRLPVIN